jgi:hypothetical protein
VGRQAPGQGKPDTRTASNAIDDAKEAAALAKKAGMQEGKVIYLDIEEGGLQSATSVAYFNAWVDQLKGSNYYPGVYCSYISLEQLVAQRPDVVPWVYQITVKSGQTLGPDFESSPGTPAVPYKTARMQQYCQNCYITIGSKPNKLQIDLSVSCVADPSAP